MKILQQLQFGDKVKMKLEQPIIKCNGRSEVICFYRGKVVDIKLYHIKIEFKYKGNLVDYWYNVINNSFVEEELKDIKII